MGASSKPPPHAYISPEGSKFLTRVETFGDILGGGRCVRFQATERQQTNEQTDKQMVVWLSGNALASINVVALRQTRLVLGWVTVCGRVNHFGM